MDDSKKTDLTRRNILRKGAATGAIAAGAVSPVTASPPLGQRCTLDGRKNLSYNGNGEQIVNLTRRVVNSVDTGNCNPTAWARITYTQHVKVWHEGGGFVAIVKYNGQFDAYEGGETPNDCNKTLDGNESGPFDGGLRYEGTGDFAPGDSQTHGRLGVFDHGCDGDLSCDRDSLAVLFDLFSESNLELTWWGFIYHGGKAGTWVNAASPQGDCGNIE